MSTGASDRLRALRLQIEVEADGAELVVRGPTTADDDAVIEDLRRSKATILEQLRHEEGVLRLTTSEFALQDHSIEFRLPAIDGTFWLVPSARDVSILVNRGTPRGRIWTVDELRMLLGLPDRADAFHDAVPLKLAANGPLVAAVRDTGSVADA